MIGKIISGIWWLFAVLFAPMMTLHLANYDVYLEDQIRKDIKIFEINTNEYILITKKYSKAYGDGVFLIDRKYKCISTPVILKMKLTRKESLKINKSVNKNLSPLQDLIPNMKISENQIEFTISGMFEPSAQTNVGKNEIYKKKITLKKKDYGAVKERR
jgi:hypothetical protein